MTVCCQQEGAVCGRDIGGVGECKSKRGSASGIFKKAYHAKLIYTGKL